MELRPEVLVGLLQFVVGSVILFWFLPLVTIRIGATMNNVSNSLGRVNEISLKIALTSIFVGVLLALSLIFSPDGDSWRIKVLLSCVVLFIGAATTLCSIKFFYLNRDRADDI